MKASRDVLSKHAIMWLGECKSQDGGVELISVNRSNLTTYRGPASFSRELEKSNVMDHLCLMFLLFLTRIRTHQCVQTLSE
jgi:hypothetical protein